MSLRPAANIKIKAPPFFLAEFRLSEYYKKIDDVFSQIIEDREEEPCLVLWWGNDGIRLNKDGTTEEIKKNVKIVH